MPLLSAALSKGELREKFRALRAGLILQKKEELDRRVLANITELEAYKSCDTVFTYVSMPQEVDTYRLIAHAIACGKRVAVPRCGESRGEMSFYQIASVQELVPDRYGIPAPVTCGKEPLLPEQGDLCIVPGLSFDCEGYRLGYGAGYYDRFLFANPMLTAGLCYELCVCDYLPRETFDINVKHIVTDEKIRSRL